VIKASQDTNTVGIVPRFERIFEACSEAEVNDKGKSQKKKKALQRREDKLTRSWELCESFSAPRDDVNTKRSID
jgi:hypothetical protein